MKERSAINEEEQVSLKQLEEGIHEIHQVKQDVGETSFLKTQKSHIYNSRDFSTQQLTQKQKLIILVTILLIMMCIKMFAINPFRTDAQKWDQTKELIDQAVEKDILAEQASGNLLSLNSTTVVELERSAEEFVRQEEGNEIG